MKTLIAKTVIVLLFSIITSNAQVTYFDDSPDNTYYDYSWGFNGGNGSSSIEMAGGGNDKFPVVTTPVHQGTNSLKLHWTSVSGGNWGLIVTDNWTEHDLTSYNKISFYIYSGGGISSGNLPKIYFEDTDNNTSPARSLSNYHGNVAASTWEEVVVSLTDFLNDPGSCDFTKIKGMYFSQDADDGTEHTVYLDDIVVNFDDALPVELTNFSVTVSNEEQSVKLVWETATEVNNYGFSIERKIGAGEWNNLFFFEGAGNSNSPKYYEFIDNVSTITGKVFYRLKQIDLDGKYIYSNVKEIELKSLFNFELKQNYPNPFNPTTRILFTIPQKSMVKLVVFNSLGEKIVELINKELNEGYYSAQFNAENLNSGIYVYRLETENFTKVRKMILLK